MIILVKNWLLTIEEIELYETKQKKKVGERIREIRTNLGYSMDEFKVY